MVAKTAQLVMKLPGFIVRPEQVAKTGGDKMLAEAGSHLEGLGLGYYFYHRNALGIRAKKGGSGAAPLAPGSLVGTGANILVFFKAADLNSKKHSLAELGLDITEDFDAKLYNVPEQTRLYKETFLRLLTYVCTLACLAKRLDLITSVQGPIRAAALLAYEFAGGKLGALASAATQPLDAKKDDLDKARALKQLIDSPTKLRDVHRATTQLAILAKNVKNETKLPLLDDIEVPSEAVAASSNPPEPPKKRASGLTARSPRPTPPKKNKDKGGANASSTGHDHGGVDLLAMINQADDGTARSDDD